MNDRTRLLISKDHLAEIRRIAEDAYPNECCGILGGSAEGGHKSVSEVVSAPNQRSDSAHNRYLISPQFFYQVDKDFRKRGVEIIGIFHSHPDCPANPSEVDRKYAWPWLSYLIITVANSKATEQLSWTLRDDRSGFDPEEVKTEEGDPIT